MKLTFKGKSAIVTGACGGIGIECVKKLNNAGLKVLMLDLKNPPRNFIKKYKKDISEDQHPIFDKLVSYAIKYFNDVIKQKKKYKTPNQNEKIALEALIEILNDCNDQMQPEEIQTKIYTVGKENGYKDNLRDWFKLIYEVVFGDENGPRMGFFISFFGVNETKKIIQDKIN